MPVERGAGLAGEVLVIGAGPAGMASAYYLERAGIAYTIVEREQTPASTWKDLYPSLRLNTASFVTHLPGMRIPLRYGLYMTGRDLYAYFRRYADRHAFNIRYGVTVTRVQPAADPLSGRAGWRVETSAGSAWFPCVIVASGRFGQPYIPPLAGLDSFGGRILHARDYHEASPFAGQRILVAGAGPSGVDIALELTRTAALPVTLAVRSDIVITRKYPYGLPGTIWTVLAAYTVPKHWRKRVLDRILYQSFPDANVLGVPLAPNRTDRRGTSTPIRGRDLIDAVQAETIRIVPGISGFEADQQVRVADGTTVQVDTVILCTGYRPAIGYLDFSYAVDSDGWPLRISRTIEGGFTEVENRPGLYLVGRFYRGLGPLHNIRREARTAVAEITRRLRALQSAP